MLTVEDIVVKLNDCIEFPAKYISTITENWDKSFISDITRKIDRYGSLSSGQAKLVLKLINRYKHILVEMSVSETDIDHLLQYPIYKTPLYESVDIPREVRYVGYNCLAFRLKYNTAIVTEIKKIKTNTKYGLSKPEFEQNSKLWIVEVNPQNVSVVENIIRQYAFNFDDDVVAFLHKCENSQNITEMDFNFDTGNIIVNTGNNEFLGIYLQEMMEGVSDV